MTWGLQRKCRAPGNALRFSLRKTAKTEPTKCVRK
jgi:hypothetical protein